jgi:cytochrome c553
MKLLPIVVAVTLGVSPAAGLAQSKVGRDLAAGCSNCHGTDGRSPSEMPKLAGLDKPRLVSLMREFRDGKRPATIMHQIAKGYTDPQIEMLGDYFAAQKP